MTLEFLLENYNHWSLSAIGNRVVLKSDKSNEEISEYEHIVICGLMACECLVTSISFIRKYSSVKKCKAIFFLT